MLCYDANTFMSCTLISATLHLGHRGVTEVCPTTTPTSQGRSKTLYSPHQADTFFP